MNGLVIFTMQPGDLLAAHMIRAGAVAYVTKDRPLEDLLAAMTKVREKLG